MKRMSFSLISYGINKRFDHGCPTLRAPLSLVSALKMYLRRKSSTTGVTKAVVCAILSIKEPLLLIGRSRPCGGSEFPLSQSERFFTIICPTPYNRK